MAKASKSQPSAQPTPRSNMSDLEAQFPARVIALAHGVTVTMRPIPIRSLSKFLRPFLRLVQLADAGASVGDMIEQMGDDIVEMLDLSLVDSSVDDLGIQYAPDLIEALIELNISPDVLGKWAGLLQRIIGMLPNGDERLEEAKKAMQHAS